MIVLMITLLLLLFITILGLALRAAGLIPDRLKDLLHRYVYYVAVPAAVIYSLSGQLDKGISKYVIFLAANLAAYLLVFMGVSLYAHRIKLHYKQAGVLRFSSNTPNTIFLGFPLILALYDHNFFIYAVILGSLADTILNTIRVSLIQSSTKKSGTSTFRFQLGSFMNPLLVALVIVLFMVFANIHLPTSVNTILGLLGKTSSYVALLVLGASLFGLHIAKKDYRMLTYIATVKLFVLPLVVLLACLLFRISPEARDISVMLGAMPVAVFSLIVTDNLRLEERLATGAILVTTCLAPLSLVFWFFILQRL